MAVNTNLFDLIKSLDSGELRYLRLYSVKYQRKGKSNAQKLFDAIHQQTFYDETAIKEKFKKERWIKHFAAEKKHLFDTLVRGLADYDQVNAKKDDILSLLVRVNVLFKKGLYEACAKQIKKGKQLALDYELFEYVFQLSHWERRINPFNPNAPSILETFNEHRRILKILENLNAFQILYQQVYEIHLEENAASQRALEEINSNPLLESVEAGLSYSAKKLFHSIKVIYYWSRKEHESSYQHLIASIELTESNELMLESKIYNYVSTLTNLANLQSDMYKISDCEQTIEKYKSLPDRYEKAFKDQQSRAIHLVRGYIIEANLYRRTVDCAKIKFLIPEIKKHVVNQESHYIAVEVLQLYGDLAYISFISNEQEEAIDWCNRVHQLTNENPQSDLSAKSQLVNLLAHYDLGNHDHVLYLLHTLRRFMTRYSTISEKWQEVIKLLVNLNQAKVQNYPESNIKGQLQNLLNYLEERNWEEEIIDAFKVDLTTWVRSKVDNVSMETLLKKQLTQLLAEKQGEAVAAN